MKKKASKSKPARKPASAKAHRSAGRRIVFRPKSARTASLPGKGSKENHESPLTDSQLQKIREALTVKRDELFAVVQRKKEQEIQDAEVGDEADIATRSVEKEMLFELTDSEKQTLDMIEAALRKMEKGVYGVCESCQRPVGRMRLTVMPWVRYCIRCQAEQEIPSAE